MPKDSRLRVPGLPGASFTRALALTALALLTAAAAHAAAWLPAGIPLNTQPGAQSQLRAVTDGRGGFLAAWVDTNGGTPRILAQRVDSTGVLRWTPTGVRVASGAALTGLVAAPDGANGLLLAWTERSGVNRQRVRAQRVGADSVIAWAAGGVYVDTATVDTVQGTPALDGDGSGGAIVAWSENRGGTDPDVYVQRLTSAGSRAWVAGGVNMDDPDTDAQDTPRVLGDGAGGAWVSWVDQSATPRTFFQRLDATGAAQWTAGGEVPVGSNTDCLNALMARVPNSDSLAVVWSETSPDQIQGARLDPNGGFAPAGGYQVRSTSSLPASLVAQSDGGALLTYSGGTSTITVSTLRMNALGQLVAGPLAVATGLALDANGVQAVADGRDGVYVVWAENGLVAARLVAANATSPWIAPSRLAAGLAPGQSAPVAIAGGDLLAAWIDTRNAGTTPDLYAQRMSPSGLAGSYFRILSTIAGGNGNFLQNGGRVFVLQGDSLRVKFAGTSGHSIDHVVVGATNFGPVPGYTFHNVTGDSTLQAFFSNTAATLNVSAPANKYRAFSLPFAPSPSTVSGAFANLGSYDITRWRLGHWVASDSAYAEPSGTLTSLAAGEGYWFRGLKDTTLSFSGAPVAEAQFNITLLGKTGGQGWTQFGSPFRFPVAVSQLRLSPIPTVPITDGTNTFTDHEVLVWTPADSAYHPASILVPGEVYWLHRNSATATTLRIPFDWFPVAAGPVPSLAQQADWSVGVDLRSGGARAHVDLGAAAVPADRWNGLSTHALSGPDQPLVLEAVVGDWGADNGVYRSVFRPDAEALVYEFEASAPAGLASATLAFAFDRLPADRHVTLVDPAAGWSREVSADAPVPVVLSANARRFRLEVTSGAPVPGRTPLATALRALGPNPFRDATTVSFALAHSGALKWEVFDVTGRRVIGETRQLAAGEHAVTWNGRDAAGARVRPGLYLIRWQADGRSGSARVVRTE